MNVGLDGYLRSKPDGEPKVWIVCKERITLIMPKCFIGKKVLIKIEEADIKIDKESNKEYEKRGVI
jgi:hypothetical protein